MANISKIQFLRSPTAGKVPTAAQLAEGEIALNTTDRVIYTKVGNNVVPMNDAVGKSLLTANRLSELSTNNLTFIKTQNDNLGSMITVPISLDQIGTGVNKPTRFDDDRLLDLNQTITINGNMDDGPVTGTVISTGVLINTRRAYAAGPMYTQEYINAGGVRYVRTGGAKNATTGIPAWNGLSSGADANGWRKQFDSAVLPSLVELGAAKSGVNADITTLNALTLVQGGNTDFNGSIYQIGAARTFQNNYRIGLIRDRFSTGGAVNPYITFVQKDVGDGDLLPTANRAIGRVEYKVSSPTSDEYAGRSIGAYQVLLDPSGSGITQFYTYDTDGVGTLIDIYSANGNVNIRNKSITSLTANMGCFSIGNLTNLSNSPNTGQPLLAVHTRDTGTGGSSSTYLGHNSGTPDAPVYSHYFRGKGTTNVDTQLGLRVARDTNLLGALTVTGTPTFNTAIETTQLVDMKINFNSKGAFPTFGINYSAAGNFGFWDSTPGAGKWIQRREPLAAPVWHFDGGLSLEYSDASLANIVIVSNATGAYMRNVLSNKFLQLKNDGTLAYSDQAIYHAGNKPTAVDVGALPITGGTVTGPLTGANNINASGAYGSGLGFALSGAGGGKTGVFIGSGDNASYTSHNLDIKSWYGIGFSSSQGTNGTTVVINTRTGDLSTKGTISPGGMIISGGEVRTLSQDSYRLTSGASVFQRFDGNTWYFMMSDTATGTWNNLRPMSIEKSTGNITFAHTVIANGELQAGEVRTRGEVWAGSGGGRMTGAGNIYGTLWGGYIYDWILNNFASKGTEQTGAEGRDAYNNCARWVRWGATNNFGATGGEKWVDAGWVMIGLNSTGGQQNASINLIGGRLQIYRNNGGWVDSST